MLSISVHALACGQNVCTHVRRHASLDLKQNCMKKEELKLKTIKIKLTDVDYMLRDYILM